MPDYSIYVLDESEITFSTGIQLDGISQGDGSHLVGGTMVLGSNNFQEIQITDTEAGDTDFGDSDGSQQLNGAHTIDGTTYSSGTVVEAEYSFTVTDGTDTWTLIAFNVNNSSPAYGTVEGIAVIGGPGGFPPAGVTLTITGAAEGPNNPAADHATPICFVGGTLIETPGGLRPVEALRAGDLVETMDNGPQPLIWTGARRLRAQGAAAPVWFAPGTIGNARALKLSQQHRVLYRGWQAELHFGSPEVLIPAKAFVNGRNVQLRPGGQVSYHHILFEQHAVVRAEGAFCESFHPGEQALSTLEAATRAELLSIFPELEARAPAGKLAYPSTTTREAQALLAA